MQADTNPLPTSKLSIFGRQSNDKAFRTLSLMWLAGIALLLVPMVTLIDVPIARWFAANPLPNNVIVVLELSRVLSHGVGIFLVLVGMMMLAPRRRWQIPRLVALTMGAGAVATLAKMFVLRPRPNGLNLQSTAHESAWLWVFDWELDQVAAFDAGTRAFPSASIATAIAFTVGLWLVLPRGRWLFAGLCFGAFLQRLYCGSHFLSDLIGGAAFGLLWSYACFHPRLLGKVFDEMEPQSLARARPPVETRPLQICEETTEIQSEAVDRDQDSGPVIERHRAAS